MPADVILNGEELRLLGNVSIAADRSELTVKGGFAGVAFHDRSNPKDRYVLYADHGKVFVWKDGIGNILTVNTDTAGTAAVNGSDATFKSIKVEGPIIIKTKQSIISAFGGAVAHTVETEIDLLKTIDELKTRISKLEAELHTGGRPGAGQTPGPTGPITIKR